MKQEEGFAEIIAQPLPDGQEPFTVPVSDLKQWFVCQRIVYYHHVLPAIRPITYSMEAGQVAHERARTLERRRTMRIYGVPDGKRHFDVRLYSPKLGLSGLVDMVIEREEELIPVDFKDSVSIKKHFKMQVATYGLLLEELWQRPVKRGFIYSLPKRKVTEVKMTTRTRNQVKNALTSMLAMIQQAHFPAPPRQIRLCVACEFRRFCNDVV